MIILLSNRKTKVKVILFLFTIFLSGLYLFSLYPEIVRAVEYPGTLTYHYLDPDGQTNVYAGYRYQFCGSIYNPANLQMAFDAGKLQTRIYDTSQIYNDTLSNDFLNYFNEVPSEYTIVNGSKVGSNYYSTNRDFNYDYNFNPSTNYNQSLYNQIFTAPDGSMSHNYQPDGHNSSYTLGNNLYMQNAFPNEYYYELWDSYDLDYDSSITNSSLSPYNYVTNISIPSGNGVYISGNYLSVKYDDSDYYKAKSTLIVGQQTLQINLDSSDIYDWNELDGDYLLFYSANMSMAFYDGHYHNLWNGTQANGVYLTDIDHYIYLLKQQATSFSIQINYLFLLDPKLVSQLNYVLKTGVPSNSSFITYLGTRTNNGSLWEIDSNYSKFVSTLGVASGDYNATYTFRGDAVGADPAGWSVSEGGGTVNVISSFQSHDKVVAVDHTSTTGTYMLNSFTDWKSGTIEFWGATNVTNKISNFRLYDGAITDAVRLCFNNDGNIAYYDGTYHTIMAYAINVWYHFRVDFNCDENHFHLWVNQVSKDGGSGYPYYGDPTNMDYFQIGGAAASYPHKIYADAVDYSRTAGYSLYRSYTALAGIQSALNTTTNIQMDFGNKYSNDTLDYVKVYYSLKTNVSTVVNVSLWNFGLNRWFIINSSSCTSGYYNNYYLLNSSFYNATYHVRIQIASNSSVYLRFELYLNKLKVEYKWTKTIGNLYTILSKSLVFDFLNRYDTGYDDYLKLFKFDYIFTYRYTNYTIYSKSCKFNGVSLTLDGSWHTADFYSIYDSSTGDGTINLEFNISNGLLEIRMFKYIMWFGCIDAVNGRRQLQQIFAVEWPYGGSLSDYVANNGMLFINIKYNFTTVNDGYSYTNTYDRHNKLELHFAIYADDNPTPYITMASTNSSIATYTLAFNATALMKSLGLTKFNDFAVTFIMIGNNSRINVFNVSLWDKRAVIPMELDVILEDTIPRPYELERMSLIYGFNTSTMQKTNFSIYTFSSGVWQLLNNSKINTKQIYYNNWTITNFSFYYSSVLLVRFRFESGYNFSRAISNFSLNIYIKYYYRTGVQVSIWKTLYVPGTVWEYRFGLRKAGTNDWYYIDWIMFGVMEPISNFQGISESPYMTQWQLISEGITPNKVFEDNFSTSAWSLYQVINDHILFSGIVTEDCYADSDNPNDVHDLDYIRMGEYPPTYFAYFKKEIPYLTSSTEGNSFLSIYPYYTNYHDVVYFKAYNTTNFDENSLTWNNRPNEVSQVGYFGVHNINQIYTIDLGSKPYNYYLIKHAGGLGIHTWIGIRSSEYGSNQPFITHDISKIHQEDGLIYVQTNKTETLSAKSYKYNSNTTLNSGDYFRINLKTTSSKQIILRLLSGGVVQKDLVIIPDGNNNFEEQLVDVLTNVRVIFDQMIVSGEFDDTKYLKCYSIKAYAYASTGDYYTIYVEPNGRNQIRADIENYTLKIYENSLLKTTTRITITNDLYTYTYKPIKYIECKLYLYSQSGSSLDLDAFHINITRTYFNITDSYWLQSNLFKVDESTFIHFKIYDIFYNLVKDVIKPAFYYIDIQIDVYELKIAHKAQESSLIIIQPVGSGYTITELLTPDELVSYELGINNYVITWTNGENGNITIYNISLTQDQLLILPSTYYQLYVSCFNFDGLGLDTDWVRLYINNVRKDFGFNTMRYEWTRFVVMDFFNATLADETIYTRLFTEYNIYVQVYNLILNNNYTRSIFITIERPSVDITVKQIVPAQSSISYRFLPNVEYIISYYHVNGTKIGDRRITLETNNQIVSFGWYTEEQVPTIPTKELVSLTGQMWLDIIVIISCFVVIIAFTLYLLRKYIKKNEEQQKYIYNSNKSKTNLEVEGLLGKTTYFK